MMENWRVDNFVRNILMASLADDREARGLAAAPPTDDKKSCERVLN